ncbi:replication-associated protein [Sewage-associated circular DNA virus-16]|uniref:Replication-associated protein n=1 Tax=Sewage-associated circular DNA virus-16 TaxID=1592083 RepID=A0A0B4UI40_9VIRU|nr:replication-associated protein [Sewage-associated circular DNA virus-16]AJD07525.1 replication-associated protein [Sewage-associated circular DNA virus-16]
MKARFWILTIPHADYLPFLPNCCVWIRGQLERGSATGYLHWQLVVGFKQQCRLATLKRTFGDSCHAEPTRSNAADDYVWKPESRIDGTQFELGAKPMRRNDSRDWDAIRDAAKRGDLETVPSDVFVQHYRSLRTISADYAEPVAIERTVHVYWGPTGVGKSRKVWELAGEDAYPKCPNSKFWDGYRGHTNVVIDEFRGRIDISHILRWFDRYPVLVEIKGSSTVLRAQNIWITSNLDPREWYTDLDELTKLALLRRLNVIHCPLALY